MKSHKPGTDFTMRWWPVLVNYLEKNKLQQLSIQTNWKQAKNSREDLNIRKTQKQCEENCGIKRRRVLLAIDTAKFSYTGFTLSRRLLCASLSLNGEGAWSKGTPGIHLLYPECCKQGHKRTTLNYNFKLHV